MAVCTPSWHNAAMTTKTPKRPRDTNQHAKFVLDLATGENEEREPSPKQVNASRRSEKGGSARANSLSPAERSEIARLAAEARWKKSG